LLWWLFVTRYFVAATFCYGLMGTFYYRLFVTVTIRFIYIFLLLVIKKIWKNYFFEYSEPSLNDLLTGQPFRSTIAGPWLTEQPVDP
jgi:hypothetical protein